MPNSWVEVRGPWGRKVYLADGLRPVGRTNVPFQVQTGSNLFQYVDIVAGRRVLVAEVEALVTLRPKNDPQIIELAARHRLRSGLALGRRPGGLPGRRLRSRPGSIGAGLRRGERGG